MSQVEPKIGLLATKCGCYRDFYVIDSKLEKEIKESIEEDGDECSWLVFESTEEAYRYIVESEEDPEERKEAERVFKILVPGFVSIRSSSCECAGEVTLYDNIDQKLTNVETGEVFNSVIEAGTK